MSDLVEIRGLEDTERLLRKIAPNHARNILRATVHQVARDARDEVRELAPSDGTPRVLRSSVKHRRKRSRPGTSRSVVTIDRKAFFWRFLEYGTVTIAPRQFVGRARRRIIARLQPLYLRAFAAKFEAAVARARKRQARQ